jgi:hypothetical protein
MANPLAIAALVKKRRRLLDDFIASIPVRVPYFYWLTLANPTTIVSIIWFGAKIPIKDWLYPLPALHLR